MKQPGHIRGDRVLISRRGLLLDQRAVAKASGISNSYLSMIETGKVTAVHSDVLFKLSQVLGVSIPYLLGLTEAPTSADDGAPIAAGQDHLVFEVRDAEMRALLVELADLLHSMTPAQRRFFVEQGQKLLRLMEEEESHAPVKPIIIG